MPETPSRLQGSERIGAVVSPTFDWKPSPAFPSIDGAFHWATLDSRWRRIAHGWADTYDEALRAAGL